MGSLLGGTGRKTQPLLLSLLLCLVPVKTLAMLLPLVASAMSPWLVTLMTAVKVLSGTLAASPHWPLLTATVGVAVGLKTATRNGTVAGRGPRVAVPSAAGPQLRLQLRGQLRLRLGRSELS